MLYLTRYPKEEVVIWKDGKVIARIVVECVNECGNVSLGIDASQDINIDRKELYDRKKKEVVPNDRMESDYSDRSGNV